MLTAPITAPLRSCTGTPRLVSPSTTSPTPSSQPRLRICARVSVSALGSQGLAGVMASSGRASSRCRSLSGRWAISTRGPAPQCKGMRPPIDQDRIWTVGFEYKPIHQVVLKLDYRDFNPVSGTKPSSVNFGLGFVF